MAWPYHFVDLSDTQKLERRVLLDRYGIYAQLSAFIPVMAYQLFRLGRWVYSERRRTDVDYAAVPTSPGLKKSRHSHLSPLARQWRKVSWWFGEDLIRGWGTRGDWLVAVCYATWLGFLSFRETGDGRFNLCFCNEPLAVTLGLCAVSRLKEAQSAWTCSTAAKISEHEDYS